MVTREQIVAAALRAAGYRVTPGYLVRGNQRNYWPRTIEKRP